MKKAFMKHWPEYAMEAFALGLFMFAACLFGALLESFDSPVRQVIADPFQRRALMGLAMGSIAILNIYSPWGQQSGAHMNPIVTLVFLRLKKIGSIDALFYVMAHFLGAVLGVGAAVLMAPTAVANSPVNYVVTVPGNFGKAPAFFFEFLISFGLMAAILKISNHARWSRWTGVMAGGLVAVFIALEAPFSGMSMNPARTLGSAVFARQWDGIWIYFTAPLLGMLAAAECYLRSAGLARIFCAKLNHHNHSKCLFNCQYREMFSKKF